MRIRRFPTPPARAAAVPLVALALACLLLLPAAAAARPAPLLWGAWIGDQITGEEAPFDMRAVDRFDSKLGKGLSLIEFSSPFTDCSGRGCHRYEFPTTQMQKIRNYGAIPFFSWNSGYAGDGDEGEYQLADLTSGSHDAEIRQFAKEAKRWGHPFFLRFNWEMNGSWFPWAERANGNRAGEYVAAWRHVHDIFASVGADNVTWVWCPYAFPNGKGRPLSSFYPGDAYVDWTSLDGYNWGPNPVQPLPWMSFDQTFEHAYRQLVEKIAPDKPVVISEVASTGSPRAKAAWIRGMFRQLRTDYRQIHGVIWFDKLDRGIKWPLELQPRAIRAFRTGVSHGFAANEFSSLTGSPILPPGD